MSKESSKDLELKELIYLFPTSIKEVYFALTEKKFMTVNEIQTRTCYSRRTVSAALKELRQQQLIKKVLDLEDMRKHKYTILKN